jgi:serine/threonine-protein kinase SRPK3
MLQAAKSQPLPIPSFEDALKHTFVVADFGNGTLSMIHTTPNVVLTVIIAQPVNDHRTDKVTPELLRAPENYIRSPWDEKIDIWSFGCLASVVPFVSILLPADRELHQIFEFVTSRSLFRYVPEPSKDLDKVENMLYQMLCYTEEDFPEHMLQYARDGEKYFDLTCAEIPTAVGYSLFSCILLCSRQLVETSPTR